jgi:glycosyltransferase involved in cell wall biosynthesis
VNNKNKVSVIILTYNEAENIERSIRNTISWAHEVIVLDSYSTDNTVEIAISLGAKVVHRKFDNYSAQRNYAIKEIHLETDWILFLDADEFLSGDLKKEINSELANPTADGYYLKRRFYFDGRWVRWGGYYPTWILRLFKKDKGLFQREINEHLVLDGRASKLKNYFADDNQKSLHFWWKKHVDYAQKEAFALFNTNSSSIKLDLWGSQSERKSWIRYRIWNRLPVYIRPFLYFMYRYFFRLGFLDGFSFHFYHGFVYFVMIDSFYMEFKKNKIRQRCAE